MSLTLLSWLNGGLLVAVFILAIHDQQNIAGLKRMHARLKKLEAEPMHYLKHLEAAFKAQADSEPQ